MGLTYISIDIETSGLDHKNNQILEFAAIIEDTEKKLSFNEIPKFQRIIAHNSYTGSPIAINMNQRIFKILAERDRLFGFEQIDFDIKNNIIYQHQLVSEFSEFLRVNGIKGKISIAGKNFGTFDKLFLDEIPSWKSGIAIDTRIIDPGILFVDWNFDKAIPNLSECKKRAGLDMNVSHLAVEDAWDVIMLLRTKY